MSTATRYQHIRAELDKVCQEARRDPKDVLLLAVSKTVDVDQVRIAIDAGAKAFGENRPDELVRKQAAFPQVEWHFIGNIQSRRIPDIVSAATLIHSVSKEAHLAKINTAAARLGKVQRVLLEVNVSGEESKSGFEPCEVAGVLERAQGLDSVSLEGFMTMAPRGQEAAIYSTFEGLAHLASDLAQQGVDAEILRGLSELSMGMTEDWRVAVALGSTIVRVGRAIFDSAFDLH